MACPDSITGAYLSGRRSIPVPLHARKRPPAGITVRGARANNLKNIDVKIPAGRDDGASPAYPAAANPRSSTRSSTRPSSATSTARTRAAGACDGVEGMEQLDKVIAIDQSPIGRTPRSNPATYTGLFDMIRKVFAATPEAKARGYKANRFSFNVQAAAAARPAPATVFCSIEMHFLAGHLRALRGLQAASATTARRSRCSTRAKSIADVLDMTVGGGAGLLRPPIRASRASCRPFTTSGWAISGWGSPPRRSPAARRSASSWRPSYPARATGRTFYVLDEPTTGLHIADVRASGATCCASSPTAATPC